MINVLYTINFLTNGGPTRVLLNIIYSLNLKKYNVTVLTLINKNDRTIVQKLKENGINVIELNYNKKISEIFKNRKIIKEKIKNVKPDIIHTHGIVTTFIVADLKMKAKKITTIHNNMYEDYKYTYGKVKGAFITILHINKLKKFNNVVCCSKTSYEILNKKLKNVSYVRNGIELKKRDEEKIRREIRKELNIDEDAVIYVYGGVITSLKRVVELVVMFNKSLKENEYLIIIGDGPKKDEAEKINNKNIKFLGFKNNIIDYFLASDVYTSFSSSEGFSISIVEALGCGLTCFLSDIPSHNECFSIDDNYYIGDTFNSENFDYKKQNLYNELKNIDRNKIKEFQDKYLSAKVMTKGYEKIYNE